MKMRAVEKYYTTEEAMFLLGFKCTKTIILKIKAREFGDGVMNLSDANPDYRIPASGLNAYIDSRLLFREKNPEPDELGISARTIGELRRKDAQEAAV